MEEEKTTSLFIDEIRAQYQQAKKLNTVDRLHRQSITSFIEQVKSHIDKHYMQFIREAAAKGQNYMVSDWQSAYLPDLSSIPENDKIYICNTIWLYLDSREWLEKFRITVNITDHNSLCTRIGWD